jgi:hypothetical protein
MDTWYLQVHWLRKNSAPFGRSPLVVQCLHFEHSMHFDLRPCWHSLCGSGIASYLKMDRDRRKRDDRAVDPENHTGKNGTEERLMNFEGNATTSWTATPADTRTESPAAKKLNAKPLDEAGEKLAAEMKVFNDIASELKSSMNLNASYEARVQSLVVAAAELFGLAPTWTAFYREILGADGVMKKCVCTGPEMVTFECSAEHGKLLEMLTVLRSRDLPENDPHEQQRMITVRIPKSLHDSICEEANELAVSVNKLCISRLLQKVDKSMIPTSSQKRRGRRPGTVATKGNEPEATDDFS